MSEELMEYYEEMHEKDRQIVALQQRVNKSNELLSEWYENWNDGSAPDGDLLDDTLKTLEYDSGVEYVA